MMDNESLKAFKAAFAHLDNLKLDDILADDLTLYRLPDATTPPDVRDLINAVYRKERTARYGRRVNARLRTKRRRKHGGRRGS